MANHRGDSEHILCSAKNCFLKMEAFRGLPKLPGALIIHTNSIKFCINKKKKNKKNFTSIE